MAADEYDGRGQVLRKDGTPGAQHVDLGWLRAGDLPEDVRAELHRVLEEVHPT